MQDKLGDFIKRFYESPETSRAANPYGPLILRIDGRAFSTFTRGMEKPHDEKLSAAMIETAKHLVEHFKAHVGYVQSDEITLILVNEGELSQFPFGGKFQKLCSVAASLAAAKFSQCLPEYAHKLPHFDCRAFGVSTMELADDVLRWRHADARRNAVLSLGQKVIGKKKIMGVGTADVARILCDEHGVLPEDLGDHYANGTFLQRITKERELTPKQLEKIPPDHRPKPGETFMRSQVETVNYFS